MIDAFIPHTRREGDCRRWTALTFSLLIHGALTLSIIATSLGSPSPLPPILCATVDLWQAPAVSTEPQCPISADQGGNETWHLPVSEQPVEWPDIYLSSRHFSIDIWPLDDECVFPGEIDSEMVPLDPPLPADPDLSSPCTPNPAPVTVPPFPPLVRPTLVQRVEPEYPATARAARCQGDIVIAACTDASGNVVHTRVLSGPTMLRRAAERAVKRWRYAPWRLNGSPRAVQFVVTVTFSLSMSN